MAIPIDPKEVLTYLNSMGFTNITGEQLKEFIRDLKKLIKYDLENKENNKIHNKPDIYSVLHETATTSFLAKCKPKNTKYKPALRESTRREINIVQRKCNDIISTDVSSSRSRESSNSKVHKVVIPRNIYEETESVTGGSETNRTDYVNGSSVGELRQSETSSQISSILKPPQIQMRNKKATSKAFIRPKAAPKLLHKTDPVALYHAYQAEWDKHKINMPGETNHNRLRWEIREKMMGNSNKKTVSFGKQTPVPSNL